MWPYRKESIVLMLPSYLLFFQTHFFLFLVGSNTGVWIQGLIIAKQVLYHFGHSGSPQIYFLLSNFSTMWQIHPRIHNLEDNLGSILKGLPEDLLIVISRKGQSYKRVTLDHGHICTVWLMIKGTRRLNDCH
jgi:hypothetical protein